MSPSPAPAPSGTTGTTGGGVPRAASTRQPAPAATAAASEVPPAVVSEAVRRQQASEQVAVRLAGLMMAQQPVAGLGMTAEMAEACAVRLAVAEGHQAIALLLLLDLRRCAVDGRAALPLVHTSALPPPLLPPRWQPSLPLSTPLPPPFPCPPRWQPPSQLQPEACRGSPLPAPLPPPSGNRPHSYSLKHAVAHLCLAGDIPRLEALLLDFDYWEGVYSAGVGMVGMGCGNGLDSLGPCSS